jgi:hypothetical protein
MAGSSESELNIEPPLRGRAHGTRSHSFARTVEEVLGSILMQESNPQLGANSPELGNNSSLSGLESIYRRYGQGIYTFCLRLLANEKAAESATIDVFVQFNREMASQPDESRTRLRLRELAIDASVTRLNSRGRTIGQRISQNIRVILRRIWRP